MSETGQPQRYAPGAADIEALARDAMERLPEAFRAYLSGVLLIVEEFAEQAILDEMGIEDPFDLTGLYSGRPVGQLAATGDMPSSIHLYRRPLLDEWVETDVSLEALITHVLIHEVGHHFGLSDDDMHALEDQVGEVERE
jgi:predicted Zn-dependent protease with MMP-like domain